MGIGTLLDEKIRKDKMQEFVDRVYFMAKTWTNKEDISVSEKLDGLAFSILAYIDSEYILMEEAHVDKDEWIKVKDLARYLHEVKPSGDSKRSSDLFSKISDIIKTEGLKERADKIQSNLSKMCVMCDTIIKNISSDKYKDDLIYLHIIGNKEIRPMLLHMLTNISLSRPKIDDVDILASNKFYDSYREAIESYAETMYGESTELIADMCISTLRFLMTSLIEIHENKKGFVKNITVLGAITDGLCVLSSDSDYDKYVLDYNLLLVVNEMDNNQKQIDLLELIYSSIHANYDIQKSISRAKLSKPEYIKEILSGSIDINMPIDNIINTITKKLQDLCDSTNMYALSEADFCMTIIHKLINNIKKDGDDTWSNWEKMKTQG